MSYHYRSLPDQTARSCDYPELMSSDFAYSQTGSQPYTVKSNTLYHITVNFSRCWGMPGSSKTSLTALKWYFATHDLNYFLGFSGHDGKSPKLRRVVRVIWLERFLIYNSDQLSRNHPV